MNDTHPQPTPPDPGPTPASAPASVGAPAAAPAPAASPTSAPAPTPTPTPTPAPAPTPASAPEHHHVHHSYIWLGSLRTIITLVVAIAISMSGSLISLISAESLDVFTEGSRAILIISGVVVACLVVLIAAIVVVHLVGYKYLYFTLTDSEFNLYSGIFNKKRVHVPYTRVQSVDQRASLLQRIFGVCTVSIDTAGGSSNKAITVPYLTKSQAEGLRVELYGRKAWALAQSGQGQARGVAAQAGNPAASMPQAAFNYTINSAQQPLASAQLAPAPAQQPLTPVQGNVLDAGASLWGEIGYGVFAGQQVDVGHVSYEYGLSNRELILTGLSNNTAFVVIVIGIAGALAQGATLLMDLFPSQGQVVADSFVAQTAKGIASDLMLLAIGAFLVFSFVSWLLSALGTCIGYGGFSARRRGKRIEVERGLLQHTFQGIDADRVQSVIVRQTFIRRLMKCCEISLGKVDAASESDEESRKGVTNGEVVVHPFVRIDRVPDILHGIIPEFDDVPVFAHAVAPVARRRAIIRRSVLYGSGFWLAMVTLVLQLLVNVAGVEGMAQFLEVSYEEAAATFDFINLGAMVLYILAAVIFVVQVIGALLWARESSFAYNDRFMQVTNGGFMRKTVSFPRQKIQYGFTKTNPLQRRVYSTTVVAYTATGVGGRAETLVDVRLIDAQDWLDWLKPRHGAPE